MSYFKYHFTYHNFRKLCVGARFSVGSWRGNYNVVKVTLLNYNCKFEKLKYSFKITKLK